MKLIKLLGGAYIGGLLRMPHEGVLSLPDAEADRLVEAQLGVDVTEDFTAKQKAGMTEEAVTLITTADIAPPAPPHPSQAEIAPVDPATPAPAIVADAAPKE